MFVTNGTCMYTTLIGFPLLYALVDIHIYIAPLLQNILTSLYLHKLHMYKCASSNKCQLIPYFICYLN